MGTEPDLEAENDAAKRLREFLVEDYKLKIGYLTEHFSRMWTRFNFFLSLETLVAGVLVAAATTDKTLDNPFTGGVPRAGDQRLLVSRRDHGPIPDRRLS